ncbi:thioesterase, partial [Xanthomonas oryzae pv. oryzae]
MLLRYPIPDTRHSATQYALLAIRSASRDTLIAHLGIVFTEAGDDWLRATMPVDARTRHTHTRT